MRTLLITTFFLLLSCNTEIQSQNEPDQSVGDTDKRQDSNIEGEERTVNNNISDDGFPFPQLQYETTGCIAPTKAPALCEWGRAAYDIVLLEVTKTSLIVSPTIDAKTGALVQDCTRIEAGFRMEGIVQKSINGLSGKITVDVGVDQYSDHWNPAPWVKPNADGNIEWGGRVGIKAGDMIGLTLHKHPTEETLGILGELFFDINAQNTIRFGELYSECGAPPPENASGLTFAKLKEEIQKCSPTSKLADERKQAKEKIWQNPTFANLGTCWEQ